MRLRVSPLMADITVRRVGRPQAPMYEVYDGDWLYGIASQDHEVDRVVQEIREMRAVIRARRDTRSRE
jgi:hypothetical protein